jgi:glycosyltransferase involved in cell wall biosynthesis
MSINKNSRRTFYQPSVFLTIGIQTYNRAEKLKRLLSQFCSLNSYLDVKKWNIEILVSDNCSSDSTPLIVAQAFDKLVCSGYLVSSLRQKSNLGLDGNSLFVIENDKG